MGSKRDLKRFYKNFLLFLGMNLGIFGFRIYIPKLYHLNNDLTFDPIKFSDRLIIIFFGAMFIICAILLLRDFYLTNKKTL